MLEENESHPGNEADGSPTPGEQADGVSEDNGTAGASSDQVHPDPTTGDEKPPFHEEGGRKFATKEELVQFYRQQRGAASRVARENADLKARLAEMERHQGAQNTAAQPQATPAEKIDEEVEKAAAVLARTGKFATPAEVKAMEERLERLQAFQMQVQKQAAQKAVEGFLDVNPDAVGHEEELADLIQEYQLDKKGTEEGLKLAYQLFFGKAPKAANGNELAQQAYKRGQATAMKKSQAGASPAASGSGSPAGAKDAFDWSLLQ